jgi:hypothetical protein
LAFGICEPFDDLQQHEIRRFQHLHYLRHAINPNVATIHGPFDNFECVLGYMAPEPAPTLENGRRDPLLIILREAHRTADVIQKARRMEASAE